MAPLAGDAVGAFDEAALDRDAAADAGAQDRAEHHLGPGGRAVDRLGQGEAVGVVGETDLAAERGHDVAVERLAVEAGGVGVLDQPRRRRQRARHADPDRGLRAGLVLEAQDHVAHGADRRLVIGGGRLGAVAGRQAAGLVEHGPFDLRAAEVDADSHRA